MFTSHITECSGKFFFTLIFIQDFFLFFLPCCMFCTNWQWNIIIIFFFCVHSENIWILSKCLLFLQVFHWGIVLSISHPLIIGLPPLSGNLFKIDVFVVGTVAGFTLTVIAGWEFVLMPWIPHCPLLFSPQCVANHTAGICFPKAP